MPNFAFLSDFILRFDYLGYWLFFLAAVIESAPLIGIFIPGATLISVGGLMASQGYYDWAKISLYAGIGAIIGDYLSYYAGHHGGRLVERFTKPKHLEGGRDFFRKYGNKSVFIGRFVGPIRAVIPFVAGLMGMRRRSFLVWNVSSGILWSVVNVLLGYFSGSMIAIAVRHWSAKLGWIAAAVCGGLFVLWILHRRLRIFSKVWEALKYIAVRRIAYPIFDFLTGNFTIFAEYFKIPQNRRKFFLVTYILALASLILWIYWVWEVFFE